MVDLEDSTHPKHCEIVNGEFLADLDSGVPLRSVQRGSAEATVVETSTTGGAFNVW